MPLNEIENFLSDETPTILESTEVKKISKINLSSSYPLPFIVTDSGELENEKGIIDDGDNETAIANFIIPKIVVEPQNDMQTTVSQRHDEFENQISKHTPDTNHLLENQIDSSMSLKATYISKAINNDSPVERSSINHYDKQLLSEQEKLNVKNHENIDDLAQQQIQKGNEITAKNANPDTTTTQTIETNNSNLSVDENTVDRGIRTAVKETINNNASTINDENLPTTTSPINRNPNSTTAIELNDKINKIYQKIEKIEDEYYGEKVKIVESFDNANKRNGNVNQEENETENLEAKQETTTNPISEFVEESKDQVVIDSNQEIGGSEIHEGVESGETLNEYPSGEVQEQYTAETMQYQSDDTNSQFLTDKNQAMNIQEQTQAFITQEQSQSGAVQEQFQPGEIPETYQSEVVPEMQYQTDNSAYQYQPEQNTQEYLQQYPQPTDNFQAPYQTENSQEQLADPNYNYQEVNQMAQPTDANNYNYYADAQPQCLDNQYVYDTNAQSYQVGYQNMDQQQQQQAQPNPNYDDQNFNYDYGNQEGKREFCLLLDMRWIDKFLSFAISLLILHGDFGQKIAGKIQNDVKIEI